MLPKNVGVLIEIDQDFDPVGSYDSGDAADNADYVRRHREGKLTAYIVSLVEVTEDGMMVAYGSALGKFSPTFRGPSLCGCDVENGAAEGLYTTLESVPDEYLRSVAGELVEEL